MYVLPHGLRLGSFVVLLLLSVASGAAAPACAQANVDPENKAWTPLLKREGVRFSFLFYRKANNDASGVVLMLENSNDYAVEFAFQIVFRAREEEVSERVTGLGELRGR